MRLIDYIHQGGPIMYLLLILNIIGVSVIIWKLITVFTFNKEIEKHITEVENSLKGLGNLKIESSLELIRSEISSYVKRLESGLNTIKIIASVSPLLGLLGTVIGILAAFQVIAAKGLNDPSLFAGGISMALITTVGGLIVAIPHLVGHNYLTSSLDGIEDQLEKNLITRLSGRK